MRSVLSGPRPHLPKDLGRNERSETARRPGASLRVRFGRSVRVDGKKFRPSTPGADLGRGQRTRPPAGLTIPGARVGSTLPDHACTTRPTGAGTPRVTPRE